MKTFHEALGLQKLNSRCTIFQNSPIESMCSLIDSQLASAFSILSDADIISPLVVKLYISIFDLKHKKSRILYSTFIYFLFSTMKSWRSLVSDGIIQAKPCWTKIFHSIYPLLVCNLIRITKSIWNHMKSEF